MTANDRISALMARHAELKAKIEAENAHPRPDDDAIATMKREKLRIKDEIGQLEGG